MHPLLENTERVVDKAIPFLVVLLGILIVLEFSVDIAEYEPWPAVLDWVIVTFFVADLGFKWNRVRNIRKFLRIYWLDIVAVFPFYLLFRVYAEAAGLLAVGERVSEAQKVTHEALLLRESKLLEETKLLKEVEFATKEGRIADRAVQFGQRMYRGWRLTHEELMITSAKHRAKHKSKERKRK